MRSLVSSLFGREAGVAPEIGRSRPEILRRNTLAASARIIIATNLIAMPVSLYLLMQGALLPFVLSMLGMTTGLVALLLHRAGHFEATAQVQVQATLITALVLTTADPQPIDFGLAIALLAPVQAALLARTANTWRTWLLLAAVAAIFTLGATQIIRWPEPHRPEYTLIAGVSFLVTGLIVSFFAGRLGRGFAHYERSQTIAYRHLVENVQDAVLRFAGDGTVIFASQSSERLFGCQRYELAGSGLLDRIHVLDRPAYMTTFSAANHDRRTGTVEVRMRRDDPAAPARVPEFIWIEMALTPVIDDEMPGRTAEIVALLRDVTERHRQETEMREARRLAEDASVAKSRFLATIGHELRTPLNAIVGFSEMMSSGVVGELAPAHREYVNIIHQSGHHLLDLVKMLLDMSRLEAGRFELTTERIDPVALVDPSFKLVEAMALERRVTLATDMPRTLPTIVADERACRQVLINLLSNAIKFSHEGGRVTLTMRRQGAFLAIAVSDRGIGMSNDVVARLGEPFFQAQDGLARRYEGTGLGFSIVKGLVELHGGSLRAVSTPGQGTTVTVLLPVNGPETKTTHTDAVTSIAPRDATVTSTPEWPDEKRRAS